MKAQNKQRRGKTWNNRYEIVEMKRQHKELWKREEKLSGRERRYYKNVALGK
jgi:hypothetical protein